ncbi:Attractin-like protein 1 [Symbiodinium microadriaticum]|uniref:Attractin-like protein 1 n=1 Tax=Symbiodinium microadriaticum TaxID=2951 RepID=A0A1Q9F4X1_SYMMI|nr:Attractin-like protein 1 [Symbiodinium microadriaticum]
MSTKALGTTATVTATLTAILSTASNMDLLLTDLDRSEEEVARQLVAQLGNSSNSTGILGSLLTQSDLATTQTLALDSVTISSQSRNISVLSENATVEVPAGVVAQAASATSLGSGLVLLSISVGSSDLRGGFDGANGAAEGGSVAGDGPSLVSRPVSIAFRKPDGQRIPMPSLVQPIEIRLPGANEEAQCAFWDEETSAWSSTGLLRLAYQDGELICQTSHLTVFGAVLDVLLRVIRCSTASQVLSAEGFANFGKGTWTGQSPTVIAFIAVFVFVLLLLYALRLDAKRALSREEVEAALLVELEEETDHEIGISDDQEPEVKKVNRRNICHQAAARMLSQFMWFLSQIFEMPDADMLKELMNAKMVTINRCISSIYAYKSHADRQSIRASETAVGRARMRPSNAASLSVTVVDFVRMDVATTPTERRKASAAKEFLKSYWCKRVVLLTRAMHPWITMQYVSLFRSHVVRASLIILKLVSTGAANALFFAASAVSTDSERDCRPPENFGERLVRAGVVGILSACMSDLLILLLAAVQWRQVIIRHWTEEAKKRQLRSWRWRRRFFWLIWFVDMGMSILYIFGFLANVSETDGSKWLESTGISLLQDLLLKPLYMALLYGTVASMVLCCSPSVGNEVVGQWMQRDEEDASRADVQARTLCCGGASKSPQHLSVRSRHKAASDVKLVLGRRGLVQGIKFKAPDSAVPGITKADSLEGPLKATLKMKGEFNLSEGPFGLSFGLRRQLNLGSPPYPAFPMSRWFQHPCSKSASRFILFALQIAVLASANDWTSLSPQGTPAARSGHTMVWDPDEGDGGFWMFGGEVFLSIKSNRLYFYNAASNLWTQKASGPAARYRHSAVLDPMARTMYVFAGTTAASAGNTFNDLHLYDVQLDSWTELTGTAGRSMHTAVWDSTSDRMIVFGGLDNMLNKLDSLAEYDRATDSWSSPAAVGPVARDGHVAVWDPATGSMLMCCGASSAATLGDLWSYNGAWSQLAPSGSITARSYASAVWDPQAGALLGFAGSGGSKLNSLFLYSASANSWSEYTETGPPAQDRGAVAWDPVNGRLYTFGGYYDQWPFLLDSLWRLDASHTSMASTSSATSATETATTTTTTLTTSTVSSTDHAKHGFINLHILYLYDCVYIFNIFDLNGQVRDFVFHFSDDLDSNPHFCDNLFHEPDKLLYDIDDRHFNNIYIN